MAVNILLIDDHFCAREAVACLLKQIYPDVQVFEAESFKAGLAIAREQAVNLVLLDLQLPDRNGLDGLAELKQEFPNLCVVMFSGVEDREVVFQALKLGAMGFVVKTVSRQAFVEALRDVLSGKVYLPATMVGKPPASVDIDDAAPGLQPATSPASLGLTPREFEILRWIACGHTNKLIAKQLSIQEQTVRNHLRPIFQKFGVSRRTELLVKLFEQGIVFGLPGAGV
ncbi:response regulator [Methylomonas koyamae]|uniref:DNA-binding response regulator n=1 Tax=Methylomonas koyamae TaxID=702114 RepID=A0A291IJR6_9GAMM|nr:response regulator transcription factor [Methylomonas koyamae]ATG90583.1 DNA-binding response regulator [Methylomonas koyamae]OAI30020.1 DNA-binding response regulator [Methylomonas koyamae]